MNLADQPAFPRAGVDSGAADKDGYPIVTDNEPGMTYRQWLTGMALQGLLANYAESHMPPVTVAKEAIAHADAAIRAQEGK